MITLQFLVSIKRSYSLKQTSNFELHACLSVSGLLLDTQALKVEE